MTIAKRSLCVFPLATVGVTLLIGSFFLLSGCDLNNFAVKTTTLIGDDHDQFPAIVLNAQDGSHDYIFDWEQNSIGGLPLSKFRPKSKYWRLQVFKFSDGQRIGGNSSDWKPRSDTKETFKSLEFDKLMRVDLDLADDERGEKDALTKSFVILLHDE
jgi:hypothetical protein